MDRCEVKGCLKSGQSANNVSHSNRHTKRKFSANIQTTTVIIKGKRTKMRMCTRCLRTLYKSPTSLIAS